MSCIVETSAHCRSSSAKSAGAGGVRSPGEPCDLLEEAVAPGSGRILVRAADDVVDRERRRPRIAPRRTAETGASASGAGGAVHGTVAGLLNAPCELRDQARLPDAGLRRDDDHHGQTLRAGLARTGREQPLELVLPADHCLAGGSCEAGGKLGGGRVGRADRRRRARPSPGDGASPRSARSRVRKRENECSAPARSPTVASRRRRACCASSETGSSHTRRRAHTTAAAWSPARSDSAATRSYSSSSIDAVRHRARSSSHSSSIPGASSAWASSPASSVRPDAIRRAARARRPTCPARARAWSAW